MKYGCNDADDTWNSFSATCSSWALRVNLVPSGSFSIKRTGYCFVMTTSTIGMIPPLGVIDLSVMGNASVRWNPSLAYHSDRRVPLACSFSIVDSVISNGDAALSAPTNYEIIRSIIRRMMERWCNNEHEMIVPLNRKLEVSVQQRLPHCGIDVIDLHPELR